jgi:hypothetical protein
MDAPCLVNLLERQVGAKSKPQAAELLFKGAAVHDRFFQNRQYLLLHGTPVAAGPAPKSAKQPDRAHCEV